MIALAHHPSWVFLDTSGYFALTSSKDQNHAGAVAIMQALIAGRFRLYTSNFVLAELHALLLTRISRRTAFATLTAIDSSDTTIVRVTPDDEARARRIIARFDDKNFSLTDASSFAIMDRLGITQAFTFDGNFSQYGLTVLTPESFR
jgi:uncharacterized protein